MIVEKNTMFHLADKKAFVTTDTIISKHSHGYFILNFWEQCNYPDIEAFPVAFVPCESEKEFYVLKKDNIILGSEKDICLI